MKLLIWLLSALVWVPLGLVMGPVAVGVLIWYWLQERGRPANPVQLAQHGVIYTDGELHPGEVISLPLVKGRPWQEQSH